VHPPAAADLQAAISCYCDLAATEGNRVGYAGGASAAQRIAADAGNLARIINLATGTCSWQEATDAATGLSRYMRFTGMDILGLLDYVLAAIRQHGSVLQHARILSAAAEIALNRSDHDAAQAGFERALRLYGQAGDVAGEARCILGLAWIALDRSRS